MSTTTFSPFQDNQQFNEYITSRIKLSLKKIKKLLEEGNEFFGWEIIPAIFESCDEQLTTEEIAYILGQLGYGKDCCEEYLQEARSYGVIKEIDSSLSGHYTLWKLEVILEN